MNNNKEMHSYEGKNQLILKSIKIYTRKDVVILGRKIVEHFLYRNNKLYAAYFSRALRWPNLVVAADATGTTKINFISQFDRESLAKALQLQDREILYRCCERIFLNVGGNVYFDLQYHAFHAALALNESRLAEFILSSLHTLIKKNPELLHYKFACGRPFASKVVVEWVKSTLPNATTYEDIMS